MTPSMGHTLTAPWTGPVRVDSVTLSLPVVDNPLRENVMETKTEYVSSGDSAFEGMFSTNCQLLVRSDKCTGNSIPQGHGVVVNDGCANAVAFMVPLAATFALDWEVTDHDRTVPGVSGAPSDSTSPTILTGFQKGKAEKLESLVSETVIVGRGMCDGVGVTLREREAPAGDDLVADVD
jgi:hypothetical protein